MAFLRYAAALLCALLVLMSTSAGAAVGPGEVVGEVSLVIGVARRTDANGEASIVTRGMPLNVADQIDTEAGGHVHVRFVDGAFVSVRPSSRLRIEEYRIDAERPRNSAVRFSLEQGVARSITGEGARMARERFRLNTPIAAIGVRGTDFVVLSSPETVRVTVNSGAVVLAPIGPGCTLDGLGPCATPLARVLSADMGQSMLEYKRLAEAPRLIPLGKSREGPDEISPGIRQEPPRESVRGAATEKNGVMTIAAEAQSALAPSHLAAASAAPGSISAGAESAPPSTTEIPTVKPPETDAPAPVVVPLPADKSPALPPVPPQPVVQPPSSLVWGRYAQEPLPGDTMTVAYASARPGRQVTVGDNYYVLLRADSERQTLVPKLGRVEFTLRDAQASFRDLAGAVSAASVDSGWLRIDFDQSRFATGIQLSHAVGGSHVLSGDGRVRDDGVFSYRGTDGRIAGATSLDGTEAAYLFERYVPRGTFSGITSWKR